MVPRKVQAIPRNPLQPTEIFCKHNTTKKLSIFCVCGAREGNDIIFYQNTSTLVKVFIKK